MANLRQTPLTCSGHTRPVVDLAFSEITPFGYFLISACKDGKPMIRQGDTGDWIGTFEGHKGAVWGATLNSDATRAATGAADFSAKLWHAEKGVELHTFPHKHIVKSVAFNKDGTLLLTGSNEKLLRIFDLGKPEAEPKSFAGHTSNIKGALFSFDGKQVFSASDDKTVRVWDADTCEEKNKLTFESAPTSLTLTSKGDIMIITFGQNIAFYKVDTLEEIKKFTAEAPINSASLHPCEKFFVAGGEDFKMYKFDYETGKEIESFKGHFGPVHCVRFSPDGELYASGSEDGTLRLWQTTIGKTYGLWKCIIPDDSDILNSNVEVKNNVEVKVES
ncbi:serine-threonine kinase receptor-associated protein-like [Littorina saxatilis]|uniref:Serine-threonine kinase receptor-associated protein n=1 Tax=Littorina saxatilis TaxID=31220 RepID=A0AAN9GHE7_9CAEN